MRADIFCRVVDNYGDIGVCWRLARRLAQVPGWRPRLSTTQAFARIQPLDPEQARQQCLGIDIVHWTRRPPT